MGSAKPHVLIFLTALFLVALAATPASASPGAFRDLLHASLSFQEKLAANAQDYLLVQFWSPFCAPCGDEVSEVNSALDRFAGTALRLNAIGVPLEKRRGEVRAFVSHFEPRYAQWVPDPLFLKKISSWKLELPWSVLVDRQLRFLHEWKGKVSAREIESVIKGGMR